MCMCVCVRVCAHWNWLCRIYLKTECRMNGRKVHYNYFRITIRRMRQSDICKNKSKNKPNIERVKERMIYAQEQAKYRKTAWCDHKFKIQTISISHIQLVMSWWLPFIQMKLALNSRPKIVAQRIQLSV